MTIPRIGFKLKIRNFKSKVVAYSSRWTHQDLINLFLAAFAILISINGNKISEASYQLSKSDTSQTAQINELRKVIINQDAQQKALLSTLKELRTQNTLSEESNQELKHQGAKISDQAVTIAEQLKLSRVERDESLSKSSIENKNNLTRLRKFFNDFIVMIPRDISDSNDLNIYENRVQFYQTLKSVFEKNDDNSLILKNDSLVKKLNLAKTMVQISLNNITKTKSLDIELRSAISGQPFNLGYFNYLLQVLNDLIIKLDELIRKTAYP